jgi:hypothetical protein
VGATGHVNHDTYRSDGDGAPSPSAPERPQGPDPDVERAARIARLADVAMIDPLVGLFVPGLGDFLAAGLGLYIVSVAVKKRVPAVVIARMLLNLGIDAAVGAIPLAGDAFDFVFRANLRNVSLLRERHAARRSRPIDWAIVAGAGLAFVAALAVPVVLVAWLIHAL